MVSLWGSGNWEIQLVREAAGGSRNRIRTCLQRELVEGGQQLGHRAHRLVGDIDAVSQGERHDAGRQTRPQPRLGHLVAASQLQFKQTLEN